MAKLFIPQKCRVGFQHRKDTFTGKLAYVIYYDSLGKIRKEKSWKGWCWLPGTERKVYDHETREHVPVEGIEPWDFENEPTSGFVLNKGIQRYNWSHFGSGRSMIRIYDPRGIEFEITPENLIGLLMHTDCSKREIQGDLVYAWAGGKIMLLPCASEEYEKAKDFTALQAIKVGARELKEGHTYVTKQEDHIVYLGRHMWYEEKGRYDNNGSRPGSKQHIFCDLEGKHAQPIKSVPTKIAACADPHPHDQTASWIDSYLASEQSSKIVGWETEPLTEEDWDRDWSKHDSFTATIEQNGEFYAVGIRTAVHWQVYGHERRFDRSRFGARTAPVEELAPDTLGWTYNRRIKADGTRDYNLKQAPNYRPEHNQQTIVTDRNIFFNLIAVFENGLKLEWS